MVESAVRRAIQFLLGAQGRSGSWNDFETLAGSSDEWVTGFVGAALAQAPLPDAARASRRGWAFLRRRRWWSAGWGYNRWVPPDADSTLWALALAEAVGAGASLRSRRGHRFLAEHIRSGEGVATYADDGPIRHFTRLHRTVSFRGWCAPHPCVTAAAARVVERRCRSELRDCLRQRQLEDGSWIGYWWWDREYTTALAGEALAEEAGAEDRFAVQRAVAWASDRVGTTGAVPSTYSGSASPFATAWCIRVLVLSSDPQAVMKPLRSAVAWLLEHQLMDGSWSSTAMLRIPPPGETDPERYQGWVLHGGGGGSIVLDQHRLFTTATVLSALSRAESYLQSHE